MVRLLCLRGGYFLKEWHHVCVEMMDMPTMYALKIVL